MSETTHASAARSTAIAAYGRVQDMDAFIRELGNAIARSQMFGCENEHQGFVLATACVAKNADPLTLVETYHIIHNRLTMRAESMLAGLQERGGDYRVLSRTAEAAGIEIAFNGETQKFTFTWDEAQAEPFVYAGKEAEILKLLAAGKRDQLTLKGKYATPRSRMQMLWARVVSDGVRVMCPIVLKGRYTPEEIADYSEADGNGRPHGSSSQPSPQVVDADYQVVESPPATEQPPFEVMTSATQKDPQGSVGSATTDQVREIRSLFQALGVPYEKQQAALAKRGVSAVHSLSSEQAVELLDNLRAKSKQSIEAPIDLAGPCSPELAGEIKQLLSSLAQSFDPEIAAKVKKKLESHGLSRLTDLTINEAEGLKLALEAKQVDAFFAANLEGYKAREASQGN